MLALWSLGVTMASAVEQLNIPGLAIGIFRHWLDMKGIFWRHPFLCQDMRPDADPYTNHAG